MFTFLLPLPIPSSIFHAWKQQPSFAKEEGTFQFVIVSIISGGCWYEFIGLTAALLALVGALPASASSLVDQTWLPGQCIPQFAAPLPIFGSGYNAALPRVDVRRNPYITVKMKETERQVLPADPALYPADGCPPVTIGPTRVWAYETSNTFTHEVLGPAYWPAVTLVSRRWEPTIVRYLNQLPSFGDRITIKGVGLRARRVTGLMQGLISVDQTIHWADPLKSHCHHMMPPMPPMPMTNAEMNPGADAAAAEQAMDMQMDPACFEPYTGPVPAVPHQHGAEVASAYDGGPEQWWTPDGRYGKDYRTLGWPVPGRAIYRYENEQEPGTLWIHDHALGATRSNVYSGMAMVNLLRDPEVQPRHLPSGPYEFEMAVQDRQFDTNSQLYFPDGSDPNCGTGTELDPCLNGPPPNPDVHPFWIPEFVGDVAVVNGTPWPFMDVEPRRYLLHVLNGCNGRFLNMTFGAAPVWVIGADDAFLDRPVRVSSVFLAPGERADIIVNFKPLAGQEVTVTNDAPIPFPDGLVPGVDQPTMANIMQFRVKLRRRGSDDSCRPDRGECRRREPMVRLTNGKGSLAKGVRIHTVRQLVLKEVMGADGPLEVLVNNTKWDGTASPGIDAVFPRDGVSELPRVGSTELWEIINLTVDAHPMHTHLTQFQILNRQAFDLDGTLGTTGYINAWNAEFGNGPAPLPDGCVPGDFCPGYGPPRSYLEPNEDGALGGNPAVSPYLVGLPAPPAPEEAGWKDTAKILPGQVLRLVVRWAPTSAPVCAARPGRNLYSFDPTKGPGYVWHCHIIDHEDNEMMRPYKVRR